MLQEDIYHKNMKNNNFYGILRILLYHLLLMNKIHFTFIRVVYKIIC